MIDEKHVLGVDEKRVLFFFVVFFVYIGFIIDTIHEGARGK